eukprot:sb/3477781/
MTLRTSPSSEATLTTLHNQVPPIAFFRSCYEFQYILLNRCLSLIVIAVAHTFGTSGGSLLIFSNEFQQFSPHSYYSSCHGNRVIDVKVAKRTTRLRRLGYQKAIT